MASTSTQTPSTSSSSEPSGQQVTTQDPGSSSNSNDGTTDLNKEQKLTQLQDEEMENVKRDYEEHEEKYGNRE